MPRSAGSEYLPTASYTTSTAPVTSEVLNALAQVFRLVVNHFIGAQLPARRQLRLGRGTSDHPGPQEFAQLNGGAADAARGTKGQERFARLQLRAILEGVIGSAIGQKETRGEFESTPSGKAMHSASFTTVSSAKQP